MAAHNPKCEAIKDLIEAEREIKFQKADFKETLTVPYEKFFQIYLLPNRPCLFCPKSTEKWSSRNEWVCDGTPNFEFFDNLGHTIVPVADCKQEQFSSHPKQDMTMKEYIQYWRQYKAQGYPETEPCLYLKDWHFTKAFPDYKAYTTPVYFQSDWLNEFWDTEAGGDDYRFVYMGPKGTWTPFHADVYRSYSWSANICGRKLWIFYPPGEEVQFKDRFGNLAYDVTSPELEDKVKYPHYSKENDHRLEIIQEQGQMIFVPSGWHHQVYNLEDTISINHNWLNGCNIDICWQHLKDNLESVKNEIADCKDMDGWHDQCQLILKASAGIDYKMFYKLLQTISENRFKKLQMTSCTEGFDSHTNMGGSIGITENSRSASKHKSENKTSDIATCTMKVGRSEDNVCHTTSSSSYAKVCTCSRVNSQLISSMCISQDPSLVHTNADCMHTTNSDLEKVEDITKTTSKLPFDTTVQDNGVTCYSDPVANSDQTKTPEIFRKMNLYPKQPDDKDHIIFDLCRLESVLKEVIHDEDYKLISTEDELALAGQLLNRIQKVLNKNVIT